LPGLRASRPWLPVAGPADDKPLYSWTLWLAGPDRNTGFQVLDPTVPSGPRLGKAKMRRLRELLEELTAGL
jgi:hypothetical protein